jgi:hypothetical protein
VTKLPTLGASGSRRIGGHNGPHWYTNWSSLLTLLEGGARCSRDGALKLLKRLLELLSGALGLLLPKVSTWSSKAEWFALLLGKARVRDTPRLSRAGGLPLLLSQLLALVLQGDSIV